MTHRLLTTIILTLCCLFCAIAQKQVITYANGDRYEGDIVDGKKHGHGKYLFLAPNIHQGDCYEGDFKNGMFNGQGTFTWNDGRVYVGEWVDSRMEGQGKMTYSDGHSYTGAWVNDQREGYGVMTIVKKGKKKMEKYEGMFHENKYEGEGTYYWNDGRKYVGNWAKNKMNGQGTFYYANGDKYVGNWTNGHRNGLGTYLWTDGRKYVGEWINDIREGQGTMYYVGGKVYTGKWENNQIAGQFNNFDHNGSSIGISEREAKKHSGPCPGCGGTGKVVCQKCSGLGFHEGTDGNSNVQHILCDNCTGQGTINCIICRGAGEVIKPDSHCSYCNGKGRESLQRGAFSGKVACTSCWVKE